MKRDYKVSIIRILSMISIVLCHLFQAKEMSIAFWLNIGVQIFLFMSGFLYAKKEIRDTFSWIKKQYKKILIPYYIYLFIIIIIYFIFRRDYITKTNVLSVLLCLELFKGFPWGLNHLWFIPVILICYLITPILQKVIKLNQKHKKIKLLIIIIILELMLYQTFIDPRISNIICYIIGYLISYLASKNSKKEKSISIIIIILAVITNAIKIILSLQNYKIENIGILDIIIKNSHILLGCAIFIILYRLLENVEKHLNSATIKIIDSIDIYCFYIYITHHIFILGPLTIINLTQSLLLNLIIVVICIIISAYILEKLTKLIKKGLEKYEKSDVGLWYKTRSN